VLIICTGYSANISEKEAAKIGVASFVMKPLDRAEFAQTIRKVLDAAIKATQG
jgi:DNA-binding NtrC family response regulator